MCAVVRLLALMARQAVRLITNHPIQTYPQFWYISISLNFHEQFMYSISPNYQQQITNITLFSLEEHSYVCLQL
jgi:hypothetical protein